VKTALKITGIILALALLGAIMAYLAGFFEEKIPVDFKGVVPSGGDGASLTVEATTEPVIEQAAGTIRAKVETVISPIITAKISTISARAGDEVKRGEVLVELDSRELEARVGQARQAVVAAKARLALAEKDAERLQRIYRAEPGAVSKSDLDRVQASLHTARAQLLGAQRQEDEAKTALSYSTLAAPISGRIVERYADPGDTARQGQALLRMYDPDTLRLEASVRESVASKLARGQSLTARVDALDKEFQVVVDEIVPSADPGSRSFLVKVGLRESSGLYPGMFGRLLIPIGQTERIYIPLRAVTQVGQLHFVIVKTEQGDVRRYVRLGGRADADRVQVISGLIASEKILVPAP
jgi:membrane fusion protein (multidrug efflux system)